MQSEMDAGSPFLLNHSLQSGAFVLYFIDE